MSNTSLFLVSHTKLLLSRTRAMHDMGQQFITSKSHHEPSFSTDMNIYLFIIRLQNCSEQKAVKGISLCQGL